MFHLLFGEVGSANVEKHPDMLVVKRIDDIFPLSPMLDKTQLPEVSHVMADGGQAHASNLSQISHAQFRNHQRIDDLQPSLVGETLEELRHQL